MKVSKKQVAVVLLIVVIIAVIAMVWIQSKGGVHSEKKMSRGEDIKSLIGGEGTPKPAPSPPATAPPGR